ncbi:MAG TPA: hypothetical protein VJP78_07455, partial [Thermoleophilia bacterium]|nr:hypothetical protein [Thermoleophilia bacterium]
ESVSVVEVVGLVEVVEVDEVVESVGLVEVDEVVEVEVVLVESVVEVVGLVEVVEVDDVVESVGLVEVDDVVEVVLVESVVEVVGLVEVVEVVLVESVVEVDDVVEVVGSSACATSSFDRAGIVKNRAAAIAAAASPKRIRCPRTPERPWPGARRRDSGKTSAVVLIKSLDDGGLLRRPPTSGDVYVVWSGRKPRPRRPL